MAIALVASLMAVPAAAQERERSEQQRMEEARRRLEAAQRELQAALEQLSREQSREAQRRMEEVMTQLRRAQAELRDELHVGRVEVTPRGVSVFTNTRSPQMGVYMDYSEGHRGARIGSVVRDGPADRAGLEAGDVITKANGQDLTSDRRAATRLVEIKDAMDVGDTLRVEFRRDSDTHTASIVLGRIESPYTIVGADVARQQADLARRLAERSVIPFDGISLSWGSPAGWLDIELISLDEDLGRYFGTSDGLLVVRAPKDERLQLRSGDVMLQVDGREPADQSHLLRILRSYAPGETMTLTIMRDRRRQTISVTVPEREDGFFWRERDSDE